MQLDACGCSWTKVDTGRPRWTKVKTGAGGRRWVHLKQNFYSLSTSICKAWLYNLNDSVDLKDQLLSLSYLLKIFEMSLNYFWAYFSPITIIFFIFQILHFFVSDFKCHFIFQIFWGVLISEGLRILKSCGIKDPQILRISKS